MFVFGNSNYLEMVVMRHERSNRH